jgi:hypothetical protein
MIGAEAQRQAAEAGDRVVVFDVPLLAESSRWRRMSTASWSSTATKRRSAPA